MRVIYWLLIFILSIFMISLCSSLTQQQYINWIDRSTQDKVPLIKTTTASSGYTESFENLAIPAGGQIYVS